tara:strand:+ start:5738 stop:6403 length:666 start_codon:yes stop_codon:yes gene_type:complete
MSKTISRRTKLSEVNNPNKRNKKFDKKSKLHNLEYIVKDLETHDLTGEDLLKIADNKLEVIPYHKLRDYKTIEDVLSKFGAVILLYEIKENFGHFTALYYNNQNNLEFFDSYGFRPDQELKYAEFNLEMGVPFLSKLINDYVLRTKKDISVSTHQFQAFKNDINTCGRWSAYRIRTRNLLTLKQFTELFSNLNMFNQDFAISVLTFALTENQQSLTNYFKD